jgi:pimeloyl-ACP methyl ester carboxylesterase
LDTVLCDLQSNTWTWEQDFADHFHLVTYDRRGCYRSSSPAIGYDLLNQVKDLEGLLDYLEIGRTHLVGSSAGGPLAILFAATRPERTRSLILVGTALDLFPVSEPGSDRVRQHLEIMERDGAEAAFDQRPPEVEVTWGELWNQPEAIARGELDEYLERQRQWRDQAQRLPKARRVHYFATELLSMQAYLTVAVHPYAESVTEPTCVIRGTRDQMVPLSDAVELAHTIPGAQMELVLDGPHSLMIRHAGARRHVIEFMQSVDGRHSAAEK